jgi:hypothetical protein
MTNRERALNIAECEPTYLETLIENELDEAEARGRKVGLEEAAKVCEYPSQFVDPLFDSWNRGPEYVREAIRKLIPLKGRAE